MKGILICGFLLDEFADKAGNEPVEKRGINMMKESFICLLIETGDGTTRGFVVDVGENIYYEIVAGGHVHKDLEIRFNATAIKPIEMELPVMLSDEPGNVEFSKTETKTACLTQTIEMHLWPSDNQLFWKGLRWSLVTGYSKQQFSALLMEVPESFFDIRSVDTQRASMERAFEMLEPLFLASRKQSKP